MMALLNYILHEVFANFCMKKNMEKQNPTKSDNSNAYSNDSDHLGIVIVILIHLHQERTSRPRLRREEHYQYVGKVILF